MNKARLEELKNIVAITMAGRLVPCDMADLTALIDAELARSTSTNSMRATDAEVQAAIDDMMLIIHDQTREMERLRYARFADSNDLELARIHLNTLHLAIRALQQMRTETKGEK